MENLGFRLAVARFNDRVKAAREEMETATSGDGHQQTDLATAAKMLDELLADCKLEEATAKNGR